MTARAPRQRVLVAGGEDLFLECLAALAADRFEVGYASHADQVVETVSSWRPLAVVADVVGEGPAAPGGAGRPGLTLPVVLQLAEPEAGSATSAVRLVLRADTAALASVRERTRVPVLARGDEAALVRQLLGALEERRVHPRAQIAIGARLITAEGETPVETADLAIEGITVRIASPLPVGTVVDLALTELDPPLRMTMRVARVDRPIGIERPRMLLRPEGGAPEAAPTLASLVRRALLLEHLRLLGARAIGSLPSLSASDEDVQQRVLDRVRDGSFARAGRSPTGSRHVSVRRNLASGRWPQSPTHARTPAPVGRPPAATAAPAIAPASGLHSSAIALGPATTLLLDWPDVKRPVTSSSSRLPVPDDTIPPQGERAGGPTALSDEGSGAGAARPKLQTATVRDVGPAGDQGTGRTVGGRYRVRGMPRDAYGHRLIEAQHQVLDRTVTLSYLDPSEARDPGRLAEFHHRAREAACVAHPALVAVLDTADDIAGGRYIVFAGTIGGSLRDRLAAEGKLAAETCWSIARDVASALSALHAAGRVHGAVRPEHVLLDEGARARLCNLGLLDPALKDDPSYLPASTSATVAAEGALAPSADVHALGLVLAEMLGGERPVLGQLPAEPPLADAFARSLWALARQATSTDGASVFASAAAFEQALLAARPAGPADQVGSEPTGSMALYAGAAPGMAPALDARSPLGAGALAAAGLATASQRVRSPTGRRSADPEGDDSLDGLPEDRTTATHSESIERELLPGVVATRPHALSEGGERDDPADATTLTTLADPLAAHSQKMRSQRDELDNEGLEGQQLMEAPTPVPALPVSAGGQPALAGASKPGGARGVPLSEAPTEMTLPPIEAEPKRPAADPLGAVFGAGTMEDVPTLSRDVAAAAGRSVAQRVLVAVIAGAVVLLAALAFWMSTRRRDLPLPTSTQMPAQPPRMVVEPLRPQVVPGTPSPAAPSPVGPASPGAAGPGALGAPSAQLATPGAPGSAAPPGAGAGARVKATSQVVVGVPEDAKAGTPATAGSTAGASGTATVPPGGTSTASPGGAAPGAAAPAVLAGDAQKDDKNKSKRRRRRARRRR